MLQNYVEKEQMRELRSGVQYKYTILNNKYKMIKLLGEGKTSKVYLCEHLRNAAKKVAVKLIKQEFLDSNADAIADIDSEITI